MLLAAQETQRGWGGPIALLVFVIIASGFYWAMETYGPASKIDNHSPTEEWIEGEEEFHQLTDARGAEEGNCGGGVVDHGSWRSYKECECGRCDMTPRRELP
jgi:hypothetical protein